MILGQMLQRLRDRTHLLNKDSALINELNSASDWTWNRIVTSNNNILKVDNFQATMAAQTSSFNIGAAIAPVTLVATKWLGTMFQGETKFNPVKWVDSSDDKFIAADQSPSPATNSPVYAASENLTWVRFAPPLPVGCIIRVDYIYAPLGLDLNQKVLSDLPAMVHESIVDKATAQVFVNLDDDRSEYWEGQALAKLYSAANSISTRQYQQPTRTRPFTRCRSRARNGS